MSTKSIIFFSLIILSIISRVSSGIVIIPKYGKKTIDSGDSAFLEVSDFDSGDKIYISITTSYSSYGYSTSLYYKFCDSTGISSSLVLSSWVDYSSSSSSYGEHTYNYKIKKDSSNAKYLYLDSRLHYPITIENTEDDASVTIIIIIVVVFVVFVAAIIIIICCCRRCRARRLGVVPYQGTVGYGVTPYSVQPVVPVVQSAVQPVGIAQPYYNVNPQYNQYNQVAQAPMGSDIREVQINQNPGTTYEKPM